MQIIFIFLLLIGCSYNGGDVKISLGMFNDIKHKHKGFNQQLYDFQFLLKYAIDDMLNDLNHQDFGCIMDFTLDVAFASPDLYMNIYEHNKLDKKTLSYKLNYTLYNRDRKYSGSIKTIDTFIIPSNAYSYIISQEDDQIAGINNLVKQLEHELTVILHNNCQ